jgi:hypothetical protein
VLYAVSAASPVRRRSVAARCGCAKTVSGWWINDYLGNVPTWYYDAGAAPSKRTGKGHCYSQRGRDKVLGVHSMQFLIYGAGYMAPTTREHGSNVAQNHVPCGSHAPPVFRPKIRQQCSKMTISLIVSASCEGLYSCIVNEKRTIPGIPEPSAPLTRDWAVMKAPFNRAGDAPRCGCAREWGGAQKSSPCYLQK